MASCRAVGHTSAQTWAMAAIGAANFRHDSLDYRSSFEKWKRQGMVVQTQELGVVEAMSCLSQPYGCCWSLGMIDCLLIDIVGTSEIGLGRDTKAQGCRSRLFSHVP
jgi:hypothetical protein